MSHIRMDEPYISGSTLVSQHNYWRCHDVAYEQVRRVVPENQRSMEQLEEALQRTWMNGISVNTWAIAARRALGYGNY